MALGTPSWGAEATGASGSYPFNLSPAAPAGVTTGSILAAVVLVMPYAGTEVRGTYGLEDVVPPAGWTCHGKIRNYGGHTSVAVDAHNMSAFLFTKDTVTSGDSSTSFTFVIHGYVAYGRIAEITKGTNGYGIAVFGGGDASTFGNFTAALTRWDSYGGDDWASNDVWIGGAAFHSDIGTGTNLSSPTVTGTGATFTATERGEFYTTSGYDTAGGWWDGSCTTPPSSGGITFDTADVSGVKGVFGMIRFRELADATAITIDATDAYTPAARIDAREQDCPFNQANETSVAMLENNAGGGGKARKVTMYTSGSGTFTPAFTNGMARITLIGAGGGGAEGAGKNSSGGNAQCGGGGGGAGETRVFEVLLLDSSYAYSVGAGGTGGTGDGADGGDTSLGIWISKGGLKGVKASYSEWWDYDYSVYVQEWYHGYGGNGGGYYLFDDSRPAAEWGVQDGGFSLCGGGGQGGSWTSARWSTGYAPGEPFANSSNVGWWWGRLSGSNGQYGGNGGETYYGVGGVGGQCGTPSPDGTNGQGYGSGGGGGGGDTPTPYDLGEGGAGAGGLIIIEEFGPAPITS